MPLEFSDFPEEVQVAFFIFGILTDNWDGMSGSYMGKIWDKIDYYFDLYEVNNRKEVLFFMKTYEAKIVNHRMKKQEQKRKAEERKKAASKNYSHNVRG
mgnify:CR=1 FL=1|tara:strand:- start:180 stop:476 length:297 start_codon:yes stop_codon:yes gene_type:complete